MFTPSSSGKQRADALSHGQDDLAGRFAALDDAVQAGVASLQVGPQTFNSLRAQDLTYARGLLAIPSLEAPTISPALFGGTALAWLKPILYWAHTAERFLPPGLDPRNRPGPRRARAPGTTVEFPGRATYPDFLIQQGELGVEIGGTGAAAGMYTALISGLTSSPSLWGRPMEVTVGRQAGAQGPRGLSLSAVLDHTSEVLRDSVAFSLSGVGLPDIDLAVAGGSLSLGEGESTFSLRRLGDRIDAEIRWVSTDLQWTRSGGEAQGPSPTVGSAAWARDLVWRTLSGIERVELEMALRGELESPLLAITSNLGDALAVSLQRELGQQIAEAEARLRAEVDNRIQPLVQTTRARVADVQSGVGERVVEERREIEEIRGRIEARVDDLAGRVPLP